MKRFYSILSVILAGPSFAQSFDVDQTSQFLRPRLRFDGRYCSTFNNGKNSLHFYDAQSLVTVPFHTRLKSSFGNLLIDGIHIETIKETKILFSQQMVSARVGYKNLFFDTTTSHVRDVYAGSLGLFGLQSLKKLNILFYSVNVNFAESSASLQHMRPGFSALVGDVKIKGLKKYYVYGVFTGYLGQRFVAVPFFGANLPIVKHHYLNFVLPVYAGYNYIKNNISYSLTLGFDGFRNGLTDAFSIYTNIHMGALTLANSLRCKIKKGLWVRLDAGLLSREFYNSPMIKILSITNCRPVILLWQVFTIILALRHSSKLIY